MINFKQRQTHSFKLGMLAFGSMLILLACNLSAVPNESIEPDTVTIEPTETTVSLTAAPTRTPFGVPNISVSTTPLVALQATPAQFGGSLDESITPRSSSQLTIISTSILGVGDRGFGNTSSTNCEARQIPAGGSDGRFPNTGPFAALYTWQDQNCSLSLRVWGIDANSNGYEALVVYQSDLLTSLPNTVISRSPDGNFQVYRNGQGGYEVHVRLNSSDTHVIYFDGLPPNSIHSETRKN